MEKTTLVQQSEEIGDRKNKKKTYRQRIGNAMLAYLEKYPASLLSRAFRRVELQILMCATGKGFGKRSQWILFSRDPLKAYADFSMACMAELQKMPGKEADHWDQSQIARQGKRKLYRAAYGLGHLLRLITMGAKDRELTRLVFILYRNIGIDMTGRLPGQIEVSKCYFADVYQPCNCRYMSAMDAGIIAGMFGGGKLHFTGRLTEGCGQCRARFTHLLITDFSTSPGREDG